MTAEIKKVTVKEPSVFSTEKKKGGSYVLTSSAVSALGLVSTTTTVSEVLDILSKVVAESQATITGGEAGGKKSDTKARVKAVKTIEH